MRGAIAFGLALQISGDLELPNEKIIKTTVQIIVLISTVVLGSAIGPITTKLGIKADSSLDLSLTESLLGEN